MTRVGDVGTRGIPVSQPAGTNYRCSILPEDAPDGLPDRFKVSLPGRYKADIRLNLTPNYPHSDRTEINVLFS